MNNRTGMDLGIKKSNRRDAVVSTIGNILWYDFVLFEGLQK